MLRSILLAEDNEDDVFFMRHAFKGAGIYHPFQVVEDGHQAINYLSGAGKFSDREQFPIPSILLLDLKLPFKSGLEVLAWIREQPDLRKLLVIILSSSEQSSDINKAYHIGANSYLVKPATSEQLLDLAKAFKSYWLEHNRFPCT